MIPSTPRRLVLASGSAIRAQLLRNAGLGVEVMPARIDEEAIRTALAAGDASPRDLADTLAEMKARKISEKQPDALVLGCDQILECHRVVYSKPADASDARTQLHKLKGQTHRLLSAAVICEVGEPIWRHVGEVRLTMRDLSDAFLDDYVARNWDSIRDTVGCYKLEEEGVRLFSRIEGDYFNVLGLPLIELLTWLGIRGDIAT